MNKLATSGAMLLGVLSHVSLVCLTQGLSGEALLGLVTGISGSFFTDTVKSLLQGRTKTWFFRAHPDDLNHSIKKLFVASIGDALDNIQVLYEESPITPQERQGARKAFKKLKQALHSKAEDIIKSASIDDLHINNFIHSGYADTSVTSYLLRELEGCDLSPKLRSFIAQHYPTQIQLCFGEGLKSPANHEAWVAYQRLMSDELRDLLQGLQAEQREIREDLKDLKLGQGLDPEQMKELRRLGDLLSDPKQFELHLSESLGLSLGKLEELANRLIQITTETHHTVQELKQLQQEQTKRIKRVQYLMGTVLLLCLIAVGAMTIAILRAPFNQTIQIHGWRGKAHIPLRDLGSITLSTGGKTYRGEIDSQGQVLIADLPHSSSGEQARIQIEDTEGLPYFCQDSIVQLHRGETLYIAVGLVGIDRATGIIKDEVTQEPIPHAVVRIAGVETQTNERGEFTLPIPTARQAEEQEIEVTKAGYQSYRATYTMIGEQAIRLFLSPR